jgi:hypothetical protein
MAGHGGEDFSVFGSAGFDPSHQDFEFICRELGVVWLAAALLLDQ